MIDFHTRVKFTGADAHERDTVAVRPVHIRLNLEYKRREIFTHRIDDAAVCLSRKRRGRHLQEMLQENLHTEVRQCGTKEYRGELALAHKLLIELCGRTVEQLDLIEQLCLVLLTDKLLQLRRMNINLRRMSKLRALLRIRKGRHFSGRTVVNTLEILSGADRPVDRAGRDAKLLLNIVEQLEGVVRVTVHLIDKGKNRNMAHDTDLEQLARLCLYSFGCIDDHHGRICRHQGTVRILREILMSRCVQNIDAVAVIIKLQNRRRDRNTTLLLDLHPVGHRMPCGRLSLYGTGQIDRSAVQQKLLCQGRLTCIRV